MTSIMLFSAASLALASCAPADQPGAEASEPRNGVAAGQARPQPEAVPVPDIDPATGVDRRVTYEPQLAPQPQERPRKDEGKTAPQR